MTSARKSNISKGTATGVFRSSRSRPDTPKLRAVVFFIAGAPTTVTLSINKQWGAGSARITATETDSTGRHVQAVYQIVDNVPTQDIPILPFQVPSRTTFSVI